METIMIQSLPTPTPSEQSNNIPEDTEVELSCDSQEGG